MNAEQTSAAFSNSKRVAVAAGPGSGKTSTLVEAVARRCREDGPASVVCITFTVAGAKEFEKRLLDLPADKGGPARGLGYCGTLHGFMLRCVRKYWRDLKLPANIGVVDEDVALGLLLEVAAEMGSKSSKAKLKELVSSTRLIRNALLGLRSMTATRDELVVIELHKRLAREGLLTLDAVLVAGLEAVKLCDELDEWGFTHLFWDEFQDSGDLDLAILKAMPFETMFIVGDPDQSIFGFRGARPANFVNLVDEPGVPAAVAVWEKHLLETNYRSAPIICRTAQQLIQHNTNRVDKKLVPALDVEGEVVRHLVDNPATEAAKVVSIINEAIHYRCEDAGPEADAAYVDAVKEMAVLCRSNRHADELTNAIRAAGIPVRTSIRRPDAGSVGWRLAKLAVAALAAPSSDLAWLALAKEVSGKEFAAKAKVDAAMGMCSVREALKKIGTRPWLAPSLHVFSSMLDFDAAEQLQNCISVCSHDADGKYDLGDLVKAMSESEPVEMMNGVHVGTLHSSKGREWGLVIIAGMEEGTFPSSKAKTPEAMEEERRLCFVGMTRAKHSLHLVSCAGRPTSRGPNLPPGPIEPMQPSRFLKEAGL